LEVNFAEHEHALKAFKVSSTSAAMPQKDGVKRRHVLDTKEQRRRSEIGRNEMTRDVISLGNVSMDAKFDAAAQSIYRDLENVEFEKTLLKTSLRGKSDPGACIENHGAD
jgi:hypothetical protein